LKRSNRYPAIVLIMTWRMADIETL